MSKCDISINFENDQDQFRSDQPVTGTVDIQVNKYVDCRSLIVAGLWKTHGRGNRDTGRYAPQSLYKGELQAGQSYS
ncbi:MAG: hypothetical protein GY888_17990, partial [Planctomycetaceae bacterium]|nr:hypothetical protein [Planctomycetaceae bacterium]